MIRHLLLSPLLFRAFLYNLIKLFLLEWFLMGVKKLSLESLESLFYIETSRFDSSWHIYICIYFVFIRKFYCIFKEFRFSHNPLGTNNFQTENTETICSDLAIRRMCMSPKSSLPYFSWSELNNNEMPRQAE